MSSHRRCDGLAAKRDQGVVESASCEKVHRLRSRVLSMGRRPIHVAADINLCTPRRHAVLDTTPLNHTYRLHFLIPGHLLEFRDGTPTARSTSTRSHAVRVRVRLLK